MNTIELTAEQIKAHLHGDTGTWVQRCPKHPDKLICIKCMKHVSDYMDVQQTGRSIEPRHCQEPDVSIHNPIPLEKLKFY